MGVIENVLHFQKMDVVQPKTYLESKVQER